MATSDGKKRKKRGPYNRYLRTDEPVPKSTFYAKRKLLENESVSYTDALLNCDAELEHSSTEPSQCISSDSISSDSAQSSDNEDMFKGNEIKIELENLNDPLYPSSSVTLLDAYISILAFSLRHNITKTCMEDLLQLFDILLPPSNLPGTKHLYYSKLSSLFDNSSEAYLYCKFCFETICLLSDTDKPNVCKECSQSFDFKESMKHGHFFIYMPLEQQLKLKFEHQNLMVNIKKYKSKFQTSTDTYRDILDGDAYSSIKELKYTNNISLQFNIDGILMYRKSDYQIWPIQCMINELSPIERKDHILMCGLWFGPHKPHMNAFLKPFVDELSNLSHHGLQWLDTTNNKCVTKVFPIICSSDAPARAAIQNFIQYNGKYGCGFCQHSGERVEKGKGFCRIYPLQEPLPEERTFEQCVDFAEEAYSSGKAVYGVKGPSNLMKLYPYFDLIKGFVPDYMHAVLLGVVRQIMHLWIQTSNNEFSLNKKSLRILNERITNIKFPQETTRKLRSTDEIPFWKASEFRVFLFVSPVILKNLVNKTVYNHWLLLVHGISLLISSEVTISDVEEAEFALQKFVYSVKDIYGVQEQSYNIHLLLHLPQSVKSWGPLWAHSCFLYENTLGQLKKFHHGTRAEAYQILSAYNMQAILKLLVIQGNVQNSRVELYVKNLPQKHSTNSNNPKISDCVLLGLQKCIKLPRVHEIELLKFLPNSSVSSVASYERLLYNNKIFSTVRYSRKFLRADYMLDIGQNTAFALNYTIVHSQQVFLIGERLSIKKS